MKVREFVERYSVELECLEILIELNKGRGHKCKKYFCIPEQIEQIENYELAKADNFKGWCIHHRLECVETGAEVNCSKEALIDLNLYYNRPANELIFLTTSEHSKLHSRNRKNRIL